MPSKLTLVLAAAWLPAIAVVAAGCSKDDSATDKAVAAAIAAKAGHDSCPDCEAAAAATKPATNPAVAGTQPATRAAAANWRELFDGKSLQGWKSSEFAGQGDPEVDDKEASIGLPSGEGLGGVTYTGGDLPTVDYEVEVVAKRVDGVDFFCGLTFPVKDSFASLIVGGWGGAVVGISSLDDEDAAHNETTKYMKFEKGKWYAVRVRVTADNLQAWIDDKPVVDVATKGKKVAVRAGIEQSEPLGVASYATSAAIKSVKVRKLEAGEK